MYRKLFPIWIRDHFQPAGVEVETAEGPAEALDAACRGRPDVLLIAFELDGTDGLQLARQIRGVAGASPIVLVAHAPYLRLRTRLANFPDTCYLAKPVGESTFTATMDSVLQHVSSVASPASSRGH